MMLGGGALPPLHPPYWPAVGRREILERFAIWSPNLDNNNSYYYCYL